MLTFINQVVDGNCPSIGGIRRRIDGDRALGNGCTSPPQVVLAADPLAEQSRDSEPQCAGDKGRAAQDCRRPRTLGSALRLGPAEQPAHPAWIAIAVSILLLDLAIYLQHVMFHAVPALWRVHRVHHTDLDFDATTGVRFHPIEIILSMLISLGRGHRGRLFSPGVVVFEVLLNASSMFNHGNVLIPVALDRYLRWLVVTPDMHRVHHSTLVGETNSNFGFNLPWWDRSLGTDRDQPAGGHESMTIGIEQFRDAGELSLGHMLLQPLRGAAGAYAITGRKAA